jgi:hypothetical protein
VQKSRDAHSENDPASQTDQTLQRPHDKVGAEKGAAMQGDLCKIAIVIRTIGAERGRAARGRPLIR